MGVDLTLLPVHQFGIETGHAEAVIPLHRDSTMFNAIREIDTVPVPQSFHTYLSRDDAYEESHYGETQEDAYGNPLRMARVADLLRVVAAYPDRVNNEPAWAYLRALLPSDADVWRVALYWC